MSDQSTSPPSMAGRTCVVTGATDGIGLATARALARAGARVVVVGRNPEKANRAVAELSAITPGAEAAIADLSSLRSIESLVALLRGRLDRIDVLVNNAGAMFHKRELSADGHEMTLALNHLGYFAVTLPLLPLLQRAERPRIVNVSSGAHHMVRAIDYDNLDWSRGFTAFRAYALSKLFNVFFTRELARRLGPGGPTVNALHPGLVASNFPAGAQGPSRFFMSTFFRLFGLSTEKGAATSVYLATSPAVEGASGGYYERSAPARISRLAASDEDASRLWTLSEGWTGLTWPAG